VQAHHVVDAQDGRVLHLVANARQEILVRVHAPLFRMRRREAPVLTAFE
jgi:hypothetical protein